MPVSLKETTQNKFNFNISLSVLNHLGRNLYRNIITVLGEAISNSWDADAKNVWIDIDRDNNQMSIKDDGLGMSSNDFQDKFLKIGYSKRKNGNFKSESGRPFIGRKGIGKLALLSCSERIHIITKATGFEPVGGIIDNTGLDEAIRDDMNSQDYILEALPKSDFNVLDDLKCGTFIKFEKINNGIFNTIEYIRKAIALYFRFSLIDSDFNIYVNEELINESQIEDLTNNTQFLWKINRFSDPYFGIMNNVDESKNISSDMDIKGYFATVKKPSQLKIRGTKEKVTIDLFVNGRLREKDILRHFPTSRIVENYVYGQIHFNKLDDGMSNDIFTSSREGVIADDPTFNSMLKEVGKLFNKVLEEWDVLRREYGNDGDPDNKSIPKKVRKAQELFNASVEDIQSNDAFIKKGSLVDEWVKALSTEAQFNIPSYTECFICENLLRKYITYTETELSIEAKKAAEKWKEREESNKAAANISFNIRQSDDDLFYLDMKDLSNLVDKAENDKSLGLNRSATNYKPVRDAVGHTSLITDIAKISLNTEYENIKARLANLLKDIDKNKSDKE
ncbi:MAG: ATP-binding protein [Ruminococcus sp.]|nr:ATP-binding protein [Ruminococcus sp.]